MHRFRICATINNLTKQKQKFIKYLLAAAIVLLIINIAVNLKTRSTESYSVPKK